MRYGFFVCFVITVFGMCSIALADDYHEGPLETSDCITCHQNLGITYIARGGHRDQSCDSCHFTQDNPGNLIVNKPDVLTCTFQCHTSGEMGRSHPVGPGVEDTRTGATLTCVSTCHSIHKFRESKLLQAPRLDICYSCHLGKF